MINCLGTSGDIIVNKKNCHGFYQAFTTILSNKFRTLFANKIIKALNIFIEIYVLFIISNLG